MSNLLEFLNTADADALQAAPGLDAARVERLLAARPFATRTAARQASGLTHTQFAELEAAYPDPAALAAPAQAAAAPTEPAEPPAPAEPVTPAAAPQAAQPPPPAPAPSVPRPTGPSLYTRLTRAAANLLRLVGCLTVLLVIAAGLVAGWLYGLPYLDRTFVQPVRDNAAGLRQLATRQAADQAGLQAELAAVRAQLTAAQAGQDANGAGLATADANLTAARAALATAQARLDHLESRADASDAALAAHTASLAALQAAQADIDQALAGAHQAWLAELDYAVKLARAREALARGYLYLSQSNFGLARLDVQLARDLLLDLQPAAPAEQRAALGQTIVRLDLALGNLPAFPVVAANDVEIAWDLLMAGLPAEPPTPTPAPSLTPAATLPATAVPTATNAVPSPAPSATPTP